MKKLFFQLQRIGKALMLPIAVLPAAALLLRLGAPDLLDIPFVNQSGAAIFDNLALLFALGVAIGLSFDSSGAAGLAGAVGYFVLTKGTETINPDINMGVLAGIIAGSAAGYLYNRFHDIKLPDYLGFFAGKRFVPIVTGGACIVLAGIFGFVWPPIQDAIFRFGEWLTTSGSVGVGAFGVFNQLLVPTGLHHVINSLIYFVFGSFTNGAGEVITGDLSRFFAGDPSAGIFLAGFYPIFMFGMPAAALAMYKTAKKENQKEVGGVLLSAALTFALTGIGEPLLFSFCFASPLLYLIHSLLTGSSLVVCNLLGIKHGFGFSAGLLDYVLNFGLATKAILIIPVGIAYFFIYYFVFKFFILKFDLKTPGREDLDIDGEGTVAVDSSNITDSEKTKKYIEYLGGKENLEVVEACITRLRLKLKDSSLINEKGLKSLGSAGVLKVGSSIQVIVGTKAEQIAEDIKKEMKI